MAIARRLRVEHGDVFGHGAFVVSEVTPVVDFEASTRENRVQARDKDSGLLVWQVEVLDADPEAGKRGRTVSVKFSTAVQPVPPEEMPGAPIRPVVFEGLTATAWVDDNGNRPQLAWSFRAQGMHAPTPPTAAGVAAGKQSVEGPVGKQTTSEGGKGVVGEGGKGA